MSNLPVHSLTYRTERHRRISGRFLLWAITLSVTSLTLLIVAFPAYWLVHWRVPFLRQQSKNLVWVGPADGVAFTDDPAEARRLSGGRLQGSDFKTVADRDGSTRAFLSFRFGQNFDATSGFDALHGAYGVAFLHERHVPGGPHRLVSVRVVNLFQDLKTYDWSWQMGIDWVVSKPGTIISNPARLATSTWSDCVFNATMPRPTRVYFGQPDSVDESRFSIRFETTGRPYVIHGQLMPDDRVSFRTERGGTGR